MCVNSLYQGLNVNLPNTGFEPRTSWPESRTSTSRCLHYTFIRIPGLEKDRVLTSLSLTFTGSVASGKTLAQRSGGAWFDPRRVKLRTLKLVLAAGPPSVWHYGFSVKSGWPGVKII
ncbi:hypothetical protein ElyMa_006024800 [Elysia marginata]|uniref:Uncharacterized protein n=1 Tax=Elysia marginata TaxID=1093978 RepID=A0AAV4GJT5_9GAST|nr:hypothetical protein ElyMa_006024800 [Elysia marginata]